MIAVLGPADLASSIAARLPGELVVGAADDPHLGGDLRQAAACAAELPLPVRVCVVAGATPRSAWEAVQEAGGALVGARLVVLSDRPAWAAAHSPADVAVARNLLDVLRLAEVGGPEELPAARRSTPPTPTGADVAAWRAWLQAAPARRRLPLGLWPARLGERRRARAALLADIRRPLGDGCRSVAVISPKGGVGKTLLTFAVGSLWVRLRGDRVCAVDANCDFGTLADLAPHQATATIGDLIRHRGRVVTEGDLAAYVTTTDDGLRLLASPQAPDEMERLGEAGYLAVEPLLRRHHDLVLYDCGTGFVDPITAFALRQADCVVVVCTPHLVTTRIVLAALGHLEARGFDAERVILVLNMTGRGDAVRAERLREVSAGGAGVVLTVPRDPRLAADADRGRLRLDRVTAATRWHLENLAAELVRRLPADTGVAAEAR